MKNILLYCAGATMLLFSSCASTKPMNIASLQGKWNIVEVNGKKVTPAAGQSLPYLAFNVPNGSLSGNSSCNQLMGKFNTDQPDGTLGFSQLGNTRMACPDMTLEDNLMAALANVTGFKRAGNNEIALTSGKKSVITLRRAYQDYNINTLVGRWKVLELNDKPVSASPEGPVTVSFDPNGSYFCETGCNNLSGNFKTNYTAIKFGDALSTRMSCPDMSVEQTLAKVLPQLTTYGKLSDGSLGFYDSNDNLLMRLGR